MRRHSAAVLVLLVMGAASGARAEDCAAARPRLFTGGRVAYRAMTVRRDIARLHFLAGAQDTPAHSACPSPARACREPEYVVGGDSVLVAPEEARGFACAVYTAPGIGQTTEGEALPVGALTALAPSPLAGADWAGTWARRTDQTSTRPWSGDIEQIRIVARGDGRLGLHGSAAPRDRASVETARMALTGEFDLAVEPHGAELAFSIAKGGGAAPYDAPGASAASPTIPCRLRMARAGPYLLVDDNGYCADGTSFSGAYRR